MIIRILGTGQFRLPDTAFARISEIDDRVQAAAEAGDAAGFEARLAELVAAVQAEGEPLPPEEFVGSDAVVPAEGTTLEEAQALLSQEGLIPD